MRECPEFRSANEFGAFCREVIAETVPLPLDFATIVAMGAARFAGSFDAQLAAGESLSWARAKVDGLPSPVPYLQKATQICPLSSEAWESLGFALDNVEDDSRGAETAFRRSMALGGGEWSFVGLARVLAEAGRRAESLRLLSKCECPFYEHEAVLRMRREIESGDWDPDDGR